MADDHLIEMFRKALRIKGHLKEMAEAKENRIREMVGLPPVEDWWELFKEGVCSSIRMFCCRAFCPCCIEMPTWGEWCCPRGTFMFRLCTVGEYPHELLKSFGMFLIGLSISMLLFFFFTLQLEVNMELSLAICILIGLVLSIGMAFSIDVRCLVFLAVPNFCSSKGRSLLIMYAMVLVLNQPVHNFSHNMDVMSDSMTCGQSLALNETKALVEAAASPLLFIISGIRTMLKYIKIFSQELQKGFEALARAVEEITSTIGKVFSWLANMTDTCNKNMGNPFRKCKKVFEDGYRRCRRKLWILKFMCSVVRLVKKVCYIAKISQLLCVVVDVVKDLVLDKVVAPVVSTIDDIKEMFYFNVTLKYNYVYNMNQSRPYSEIRKAIKEEIRQKLSIIDVIQGVIDNITCVSILLVVYKAFSYRRKYLNKDHFDNCYLTRRLREIDARRYEMEKDVVFPLRAFELYQYIPTFTWYMTIKEMRKLFTGLLFWLFAVFQASYYMLCDYGLYWILDLIRRKFDVRSSMAVPPHLQLHVQGQGAMADMYKSMVGVVEPVADEGLDVDTTRCLPNPREPNYAVYKTVWGVLGAVFFLTLLQAYALRLQHIVANMYYPHRERARAVWLYNHILLTRDGFARFTRKQISRKYMNDKAMIKHSFLSRFAAQSKYFRALLSCFGRKRKYCMSCSIEGSQSDNKRFTHCINCKSPYCNDCFLALENVCTACMNPLDYTDVDGLSIETDSSEDEQDRLLRVKSIQDRKQVIKKQQEEKPDPKEMVLSFQKRYASDHLPESTDSDRSDEESTSSYDTDYQHQSAATCSEGECPIEFKHKKRRDKVTVDIFDSQESD